MRKKSWPARYRASIIVGSFNLLAGAVEAMKTGALASVVEFPEAYAIMPRPADGALERWKLLQDLKRATKEALRDNGPYGGVRAGTTAGAV